MQNLFVSYEIALRLKEKGFNEPCLANYHIKEFYTYGELINYESFPEFMRKHIISVPLYQQVIDWFREKHDILIYPHYCEDGMQFMVTQKDHMMEQHINQIKPLFDKIRRKMVLYNILDYNEALNQAIEKALTLI